MTQVVLRRAGLGDCAALARLHSVGGLGSWRPAAVARVLGLPSREIYVLEEANRVSAFLDVVFTPPEAEIVALVVDPESRRKGFATRLLAAGLQPEHGASFERVFLELRASNQAAYALYTRHAFRQTGVRPNYYRMEGGGREDALLMEWLGPAPEAD